MDLRLYFKQQPVMLALLAVLGVIFFLAVAGLSRAYHAQRNSLGNRWFSRGVADLSARRARSRLCGAAVLTALPPIFACPFSARAKPTFISPPWLKFCWG